MKKIYMNQFLLAGTLTGCLFLASCDKEQEFTTGMPEQQLINSIELEVTSKLPLAVGMDSTIVYKVAPEDAADKEVMWTSSNEKVAAVSQNGTITALTEGEAVITVKPVIGFGVTDVTEKTITVSVIPEIIEVTDIRLTNKDDEGNPLTSLYPGDEQKLTYTLLPENHTYSYLTWGSSDETIATVAEDGTVTAVTPGNVVIYAYTHDGSGYRGEFPLVINEIVNAEDISIEDLPALHMYQTAKLSCTFVPEIAVANSVDWESSDENVVTVKNGKVTAVGFGEATVTGTCRATGNKAATTVKVTTGWWVWDAACGFDGWGMGTKGASFEVTEDRMVVTTATQSSGALRADLTLDTKNMKVIMDLVNYPVIALHANLPDISKQGYTLDLVASNGTKGESKLSKGKALSDGTKLLVYNVKSLNKFTEEEVTFTTFQIKIADMMSAELPTGRYEMYWIRTFASEEEAVLFAEDQIAANK